ncbi:ribose-phosphate diphosphokinase [Bacillus sp. 1NLA3E]|uniref:ribose-phosphate diphosphokinase n=1 Tax=Bacillus sp. 1NLA3E TaxID=666686 RepID=UPI000247EDE5|nr:ribose-phosphate pyrophosphokinase [Bacillus sp. 1NLA3E]
MNNQLKNGLKIFTLNSNPELAAEMAQLLGCELGNCSVKQFSDGEIQINIEESVRGCDVYLVQSTSQPVNTHIMELLIMVDAMKRASAKEINVVIPYFGYSRQDRQAGPREPISAKLVANLLEKAGATRIITMDFHSPQMQGFFDIPVDELRGAPILSHYFEKKGLEDVVVVAPHKGGVTRARKMASQLNTPIALIDERAPEQNFTENVNVIGNVKGKTAILFDDLINTAETITTAAHALEKEGAIAIYACCTHAVFLESAIRKIEASPIKELVVTNTIKVPEGKMIDKMTILSVAPLLVEAINRIHNEKSVSPLFEFSFVCKQ